MFAPALVQQVVADLSRFRPDPTRMAVLEARPLFLYTGNWTWSQPWVFFRSGFYVGAIAVIGAGAVAVAIAPRRSSADCLFHHRKLRRHGGTKPVRLLPCAGNRGGVRMAGGESAGLGRRAACRESHAEVRRPLPFQREIAVIAVAGVIVAPNLVPAAITTKRAGGMADYWLEAMQWLRIMTPEPFGSADHYVARYDGSGPPAAYTIMNWWDQGYWIIHSARRVPVSNPTQGGAPIAAAFLTATDESEALAMLASQRARYVIVDFELPFRDGNGARWPAASRISSTGRPSRRRATTRSVFHTPASADPWQPTWIFREAYYQSMAYKLMVLGGAAASPENNTYVVELRDRVDLSGRQFCEVASRTQFATAEQAKAAAAQAWQRLPSGGLTPWFPAFPVAAVTGLRQIADFREPAQKTCGITNGADL